MSESMIASIQRLQAMTVGELQREWLEVFGESSRSRHRDFLWKRLAWELQARVHGRLPQSALDRIDELNAEQRPRFLPPRDAMAAIEKHAAPRRDHRLPAPGSVIVRRWRDRDLRLLVRDDGGFELAGQVYKSLTEAARAATGAAWNGRLFWGLSKRKRRS
jgi:hypothetical protein